MPRVVIDTHVFIRYLIRPSAAVKPLVEVNWVGGQIQIMTAPELLAELTDVLKRASIQRYIRAEEGEALLSALGQRAEILPTLGVIPDYTRDPKDDRFVACALAGRASHVVTFDDDLLSLDQVGDVRMVTPRQLLAELNPP